MALRSSGTSRRATHHWPSIAASTSYSVTQAVSRFVSSFMTDTWALAGVPSARNGPIVCRAPITAYTLSPVCSKIPSTHARISEAVGKRGSWLMDDPLETRPPGLYGRRTQEVFGVVSAFPASHTESLGPQYSHKRTVLGHNRAARHGQVAAESKLMILDSGCSGIRGRRYGLSDALWHV